MILSCFCLGLFSGLALLMIFIGEEKNKAQTGQAHKLETKPRTQDSLPGSASATHSKLGGVKKRWEGGKAE